MIFFDLGSFSMESTVSAMGTPYLTSVKFHKTA